MRDLLDGAVGAVQQLNGAFAAHFVLQSLQRSAFFFQLAVQCARRQVQALGQRLGASSVVIVGIAGVVGVLVALLAMAEGYRQTVSAAGNDETAIVLRYMSDTGRLQLDRRAGADGYPRLFPSVESMPVRGRDTIELTLWIDEGCIEIFADGGTRAFTNLTAVPPGPVAWIAPIGSAVVVEQLRIAEPTR